MTEGRLPLALWLDQDARSLAGHLTRVMIHVPASDPAGLHV